jgi:hypothetical protein
MPKSIGAIAIVIALLAAAAFVALASTGLLIPIG